MDEESEAVEDGDDGQNYNYLLGMALWSLTHERKEELIKQRDTKMKELADLQGTSPEQLWIRDLDALLEEVLNLTFL